VQREVAATATTKTAKAKPAKSTDSRKITVLAKECPHEPGSKRAGWFQKLKSGMSVQEAVAAGVRSAYLRRMHARKVVKLG
jgi:hypothetical protein